jgi:putative nucleotidyltransferase with HDIG domain
MTEATGGFGTARLAGEQWRRRALASAVVRGLILAVPVGAAFGAGIAVSGALTPPRGLLATVGWYCATLAASLAALLMVDRIARRFLPLSVLLRMTLVFPNQAPSRLAVALTSSSRSRLSTQVARAQDPDVAASIQVLVTLAAALNSHDRRTRGHSERVRALADLVGEELGLSSADADRLRWAAFLHDIGKLRVPARVLNKRGSLTAAEWRLIDRHPDDGQAMAEPLRPWLGEWIDAIGQHHERYDGTGYPHRLERRQIALGARIVAVADSFETMTAVRSYNKPKTVAEARHELVRGAGTHFDPRVVRAFLAVSLGKLRWRLGVAAWIAELSLIGIPTRASAEVVTAAAGFETTTNALLGAAVLAVAGVAMPAVPALTTTAVWAEAHASASTADNGRPATASPTAASPDTPSGAPAVGSQSVESSNPDGSPSSPDGGGPPGTDPTGPNQSPTGPSPKAPGGRSGTPAPGTPSFVPPGLGGIPPGLTRITPGRNGAVPPGQGGTPPGHTGILP